MPDKDFHDYRNDVPYIKDFLTELSGQPYAEMCEYRSLIEKKKMVHDKAYYTDRISEEVGKDGKVKRSDILHSPLSAVISERFFNLLKHPTIQIEKKNDSIEAWNAQQKMEGLDRWAVRTSGAEAAFNEQKAFSIPYGDAYVRDVITLTENKGNKAINRKKYGFYAKSTKKKNIQAENLTGENIMFDPCGVKVFSERIVDECSYYAHTDIFDKRSLVREFGQIAAKMAQPGFMVDSEGYTAKQSAVYGDSTDGSDENKSKGEFYEVITIVDTATLSVSYLMGANAWPQKLITEGGHLFEPYKKKPKFKGTIFGNKFPYYDYRGRARLGLYPLENYENPVSVRNRGVVDRVYGPQVCHEQSINIKHDGLRQSALQVKYVSNVKPSKFKPAFAEYMKELATNVDALLVMPSGLGNQNEPKIQVAKADGSINDTAGENMVRTTYSLARDTTGVDPQRQEIQTNLGLGQSAQLAEEQVVSVNGYISRNFRYIEERRRGLLAGIIRNKGFGIKEIITVKQREELSLASAVKGAFVGKFKRQNDKIVVEFKKDFTVVELCEDAQEDIERVFVDMDSMVNQSVAAQVEAIIKALQYANPQVNPEEHKALMRHLFKGLKVPVPENNFKGAENGKPQGGASQHQDLIGAANAPAADPNLQPTQ